MKKLQLTKTETNNKAAKFIYRVVEDGKTLVERKSNRDYVACYVTKGNGWDNALKQANNEVVYGAPYFFGRMDLVGKGDSRHMTGNDIYALAVIE